MTSEQCHLLTSSGASEAKRLFGLSKGEASLSPQKTVLGLIKQTPRIFRFLHRHNLTCVLARKQSRTEISYRNLIGP